MVKATEFLDKLCRWKYNVNLNTFREVFYPQLTFKDEYLIDKWCCFNEKFEKWYNCIEDNMKLKVAREIMKIEL